MSIIKFIEHARNRAYMSGVERDTQRVKQNGEVFTPTALVQEIIEKLPLDQFKDPTKTFLDPTCGDGQFLSEVMIKKMQNGSTYAQALGTTYGADLMEDNCKEVIRRLYGEGTIRTIKAISVDPETFEVIQEFDLDFPDDFVAHGIKAVFTFNGKLVRTIVQANGLEYDYSFDSPVRLFTKRSIKEFYINKAEEVRIKEEKRIERAVRKAEKLKMKEAA
jgi:hypothetical protein